MPQHVHALIVLYCLFTYGFDAVLLKRKKTADLIGRDESYTTSTFHHTQVAAFKPIIFTNVPHVLYSLWSQIHWNRVQRV